MDTENQPLGAITSDEVAEIVRAVRRREEAIAFLRDREHELERELATVRNNIAELERSDVRPTTDPRPTAAASAEDSAPPASGAVRADARAPKQPKPAKPRPQKPPIQRLGDGRASTRLCGNCRQPGHQARTCKAPTLAPAALVDGPRFRVPSSTDPRLVKKPKVTDNDELPG